MKTISFVFLFIISTIHVLAQTNDKTYLTHGFSNDGDGYNVCEIVIHKDSSYTFKKYKVAKRKDRKNYKSATPTVSFGKIERDGAYYIHTEYKNDKPTDSYLVSRLSDKKLILYKEHDDGWLERLEAYKRID